MNHVRLGLEVPCIYKCFEKVLPAEATEAFVDHATRSSTMTVIILF